MMTSLTVDNHTMQMTVTIWFKYKTFTLYIFMVQIYLCDTFKTRKHNEGFNKSDNVQYRRKSWEVLVMQNMHILMKISMCLLKLKPPQAKLMPD